MQMSDLIKPIEECSQEELVERLKQIRNMRTVTRPAAKTHEKRAKKKEGKVKVSKVEALLANLSPEDLQKLLEGLNG